MTDDCIVMVMHCKDLDSVENDCFMLKRPGICLNIVDKVWKMIVDIYLYVIKWKPNKYNILEKLPISNWKTAKTGKINSPTKHIHLKVHIR